MDGHERISIYVLHVHCTLYHLGMIPLSNGFWSTVYSVANVRTWSSWHNDRTCLFRFLFCTNNGCRILMFSEMNVKGISGWYILYIYFQSLRGRPWEYSFLSCMCRKCWLLLSAFLGATSYLCKMMCINRPYINSCSSKTCISNLKLVIPAIFQLFFRYSSYSLLKSTKYSSKKKSTEYYNNIQSKSNMLYEIFTWLGALHWHALD